MGRKGKWWHGLHRHAAAAWPHRTHSTWENPSTRPYFPAWKCRYGCPGLCVRAAARPTECRCKRRSEEHTSELQSLMRISYAVFCLKKTKNNLYINTN